MKLKFKSNKMINIRGDDVYSVACTSWTGKGSYLPRVNIFYMKEEEESSQIYVN